MPRLFPQLLAEVGRQSALQLSTMTIAEAIERATRKPQDPSSNSVFSATGGTPITLQELIDLRNTIVAKAREFGYPTANKKDNLKCDAHIAMILRDGMGITPSEAASGGIWEYLACVLMPDIVIWRFRDTNGRTSTDRLLSGVRNNFQRLWWRAYVFAGHLEGEDVMRMLTFLTEDDTVATLERTRLFGNLKVIRLYYSEFREAVGSGGLGGPREAINRDAHKRLLRLCAVRALESLPESALRTELRGLIEQARTSVKRTASSRRS